MSMHDDEPERARRRNCLIVYHERFGARLMSIKVRTRISNGRRHVGREFRVRGKGAILVAPWRSAQPRRQPTHGTLSRHYRRTGGG